MSTADEFVDAIVAADRRTARALALTMLTETVDAATLYATSIQEALYEVGRRWQAGELTVAQEHAATTTVQFVLSSLYMELGRSSVERGSAVVAGLPGERHQLGAHMVADVLELDGWHVQFLGADVPTDALLETIDEHRANLVGLSVTMAAHLPELASAIESVRGRFGDRLSVIVGGQAGAATDVTGIGANAYACDALEARGLARELGVG